MSSLSSSRRERRPLTPTPRQQQRDIKSATSPVRIKKIPKKNQDSSSHRLSKPTRIHSTITPQSQSYVKYSVRYYKDHPDEENDVRSPKEKLIEIDGLLDKSDSDKDKFTNLVKQKILRLMEYGEISKEVCDSYMAIASFYQQTHKPQSAIRNYKSAQDIVDMIGCIDDTPLEAAIGTGECHLELAAKSKKHINQAAKAIEKYRTEEIKNPDLKFRRDYIIAKVMYLNHSEGTCDAYANAVASLNSSTIDDNEFLGNFCFEFANAAYNENQIDLAKKYANIARSQFKRMKKLEKLHEVELLIEQMD